MSVNEATCVKIIEDALRVCTRYKPRFGGAQRAGVSFAQFLEVYSADPFYSWFGLNSSQIYAAHKAAGGLTSLYRQIGLAAEKIFRHLLQSQLGLLDDQVVWSYSPPGSMRVLKLDGRIDLEHVATSQRRQKAARWIQNATKAIKLEQRGVPFRGVVFECRQGYKSKDAKRQNADIANATSIIGHNYLPCMVLFSQQIDADLAERYRQHHWLILTGTLNGTACDSTYLFARAVLDFDLAGFFERHAYRISATVQTVLEHLLSTQ